MRCYHQAHGVDFSTWGSAAALTGVTGSALGEGLVPTHLFGAPWDPSCCGLEWGTCAHPASALSYWFVLEAAGSACCHPGWGRGLTRGAWSFVLENKVTFSGSEAFL